MDELKILGAEKKRSRLINNVKNNDRIILFSTLDIDKTKSICFVGYTMVDMVYDDDQKLYDLYESKKKLKLKGIKYFSTPIVTRTLADKLNFIENEKKSAEYFKTEYREIDGSDFQTILNKSSLIKEFPAYFESVTFNLEEFLLNMINVQYNIILKFEKRNHIEIKIFLKILNKSLKFYGISKNLEDIEDFYAKNVWKLGFRHQTSRDPDQIVALYNRDGKKRNFSYITLE